MRVFTNALCGNPLLMLRGPYVPPDVAVDLRVAPLAQLRQRRSEKWALHDDDVLSLTVAEMDFPIAPPIAAALTDTIARSDLGYALPTPARVAGALAEFAVRRMRWRIDPEQVTVIPDVMVGLRLLSDALADRGERIAFATPAYPPFFHELPEVIAVDLVPDGGLDLAALDRTLARRPRALVLTSPHNPTGRVYTRSELQAIAERCAAAETWVLADEIHAPIVRSGVEHLPWLEVSDAARRWGVSLTSASKAFNLAALKTAFVVTASPAARELVAGIRPQHDHTSLLGQIGAEVAFREGDPWLDAVLLRLDENCELLAGELRAALPEIRWTPPQATFLAWLDCGGLGLDDDPSAVFERHGRVALAPGPTFGAPGAGHVRLNFATGPAQLTEAVVRMRRAVGR